MAAMYIHFLFIIGLSSCGPGPINGLRSFPLVDRAQPIRTCRSVALKNRDFEKKTALIG
jgi:hypothetical protein